MTTSRDLGRNKRTAAASPALGLRANWQQFALLVAVNAFVGGMVGLERSILPLLAKDEFGITSKTAAVSFIATFGLAKALTNLFAGSLSERFGRRRILIAGWIAALPVPFMIIFAPSWGWIIAANAFLGINQGLAWSMTVNMKIDLVGPRRRGMALGFNEAAGYLSVAAAAFLAGVIAQRWGLRPEPFYLGIAFAACGLAISVLFVRDTAHHVLLEAVVPVQRQALSQGFADATWRRPALFGASQAGFMNNLNDGLVWGVFPLLFVSKGLRLNEIAFLAASYPLVWGGLQLVTGWVSDWTGRKPLVVCGMLLQGGAIAMAAAADGFDLWLVALILLGIGTAMVYPTLLAAVGDVVRPRDRATTLGVYRFWRDAGSMTGALAGGVLADRFGFGTALNVVAALTAASGVFALFTMAGRTAKEQQ